MFMMEKSDPAHELRPWAPPHFLPSYSLTCPYLRSPQFTNYTLFLLSFSSSVSKGSLWWELWQCLCVHAQCHLWSHQWSLRVCPRMEGRNLWQRLVSSQRNVLLHFLILVLQHNQQVKRSQLQKKNVFNNFRWFFVMHFLQKIKCLFFKRQQNLGCLEFFCLYFFFPSLSGWFLWFWLSAHLCVQQWGTLWSSNWRVQL